MSDVPITVQGTIKADGTLELDEKVHLPAGRARVTVQPLPALSPSSLDDSFWRRMQTIWDGQKARGHVPRSEEEVEAARRALRAEAEEEMEEAERTHWECQEARRAEGPDRSVGP